MGRFVYEHADRTARTYAPSLFAGGWITDRQEGLVEALEPYRGKLERADHYKLYEAAYYAQGTILEIGRLAGKSTVCLALGALDAGHGRPVYSIEYEHKHLPLAETVLRAFGVLDRTTLIQGDSAVQAQRVPLPLDTVFVDGDHSYEGVRRDADALTGLIAPGGVVMFHDYFHPANDAGEFGVRRAVEEIAPLAGWAFRGRFGGIAMFEQALSVSTR